jgi:hypothetical protein
MHDTKTTRCEVLPWNDANAQRLLDWQPGDAEAAAAIEAMQETYGGLHGGHTALVDGQLVTTWNVGERVKFRHKNHGELVGTIIEVLVEEGELSQYHIAAHVPGKGRQHFAVLNRDVLIF